jgi:hypothetical protein
MKNLRDQSCETTLTIQYVRLEHLIAGILNEDFLKIKNGRQWLGAFEVCSEIVLKHCHRKGETDSKSLFPFHDNFMHFKFAMRFVT